MQPLALRRRLDRAAVAWTGLCVAGYLFLCWLERRFVTDDAWITVRYADNLSHGLDFGWNRGGPRVEGFSNPALVVVEAVSKVFGIAPLTAARLAGVGCGVVLLVLLHRRAPALFGATATRVALLVTALFPALALWAVGGLETVPAALALTAGVLPLCAALPTRRDAARAGVALAVFPWLRPEGVVIALSVAVLAEAPSTLRRAGRRDALVRLTFAAGPPIASQLVLGATRLAVYGHVLPNPFFNKTRVGAGLAVLNRFVDEAWPVLVLAAAGVVLARGRQRLLAVPPLVYGLGSVGALDNVNFFSRYFLPIWPLCALLAGVAVAAAVTHLGRLRGAVATTGALALVGAMLFLMPGEARALHGWSGWYAGCREQVRETAAAWLRAATPPDARFSISDAGLVPVLAGGRTAIDQLWLNEPILQHTGPRTARQHADYVLARRPDAILLASQSARALVPLYKTDRALSADPRLRQYHLATVARSRTISGCHYALYGYRRRD